MDFDGWDAGAKITLVMLMFIGGCAGSTAGGIKVIWALIVLRTIFADVFRVVGPRAVTPLKVGDRILPEGVRMAVLGLFASWIMVFASAAFLVGTNRDDPFSAATTVAATLNVIGPGMSQVGASESYEAINAFGRVVLTLCMLLGRLEIFTALALFSPAFWRR